MPLIRLACSNAVESASSLTCDQTVDPLYPLTRLVDRNAMRDFRATGGAGRNVQASGNISGILVNALMIPAGHTVGGVTYGIYTSANGTDWTTITTGVHPAGTGVICVEFAETSAAYWKVWFGTAAAITLTELLLTHIYTFTRQAARPSGALEKRYNVKVEETSAGSERFIEFGPERRRRAYKFPNIPVAMSDEITGRIGALGGKKPFFLCDHTGAWIWCRLEDDRVPREIAYGRHELDLTIIESV